MADSQNPPPEPISQSPANPIAPATGQPCSGDASAAFELSAGTLKKIREWEQVLEKEHEAITIRRDRQGFPTTTAAPPVGLAFSGGGIRSASFNLGLLQAFYKSGLLRFVDYLSTISGGSYIGAWFSQQVCRLPKGKVIGPDNLPLGEGQVSQAGLDELTRQQDFPRTRGMVWRANPAIARLLRAGHYLSHPLLFANRYLIGLVKTNLIFGSVMLLVCAVLALAWRALDMPTVCEAILVLTGGVLIEAVRPFMIPLVFLLAWALGWALFTSKPGGCPKGLGIGVFLGLSTLTISLAVLEQFDFYRATMAGVLWIPDSVLWKILRPLPLLLTIAWPMACVMRTPPSPARRAWIVGKLLAGVAALTLAVFLWSWLDKRYPMSDLGQVVARIVLILVGLILVFREGLALALTFSCPDTGRMAHRNLRWFLLLAGASVLLAAAVWLANPSINFATTTQTAPSSFMEGRTEKHDSWLTPILGLLVTFLLPFLRPRRLLESGLRPTTFWEPWVFRIACTAAVIGIPLVGVYFFARHDLSGRNASRSPLLHHAEFDWALFWQRVRHEHLTSSKSPGDLIWNHLDAQVSAPGADPRILEDVPMDEKLAPFDNLLNYLARMVREQPDPLSERVAYKKKWIVKQLNSLIFLQGDEGEEIDYANPKQFQERMEDLFGPLIQKQKDTQRRLPSEEHPELDKRPWPNWAEIRPLLRQVEKREPGNTDKAAQTKTYQRLNRLILEAYLGDEVSKKARVLRPVVVAKDQGFRTVLVLALAALFSLTAGLVRVNSTSLHRYYRAQLSRVYLDYDRDRAEEDEGSRQLSHLETVTRGGPYHLIGAALNVLTIKELLFKVFGGSKDSGEEEPGRPRTDSTSLEQGVKGSKECTPSPVIRTAPDFPPPGCTDAFLFSNQFCGSDYTGFEPTKSFEARAGVRLGDGIALSGAAVSLTQIDNPLILLLMTVLNLRLGQWLPRPNPAALEDPARGRARQPNLWELLAERAKQDFRRYFFVTDGGHHDNLGLEVLLRRRCRLIIVSDATCDPEYGFLDFMRVWQRQQQEHGIRLLLLPGSAEGEPSGLNRVRPLCLCDDRLKPESPAKPEDKDKSPERKTAEKWSSAHYFIAQIQYPDDPPDADKAYLIYLKPSITGDEAEDLKGHWASHAAFPHDPTSNQFYDENMVNAYRQLGEHIGQKLSEELGRSAGINWWREKDFSIRHWVEFWIQSLPREETEQAEKGKPEPTSGRGTRGDSPAALGRPKRISGKHSSA